VDRESYSLAAGFALGMITLCQGDQQFVVVNKSKKLFITLISSIGNDLMSGTFSGSQLTETLYYHMVGGRKPPDTGKPKFQSPCYQTQVCM